MCALHSPPKAAIAATLLLLLAGAPVIAQTAIYVDAENPPGDGTTWQQAHNDLQVALSYAPAGTIIRVAAGTYYPDGLSGDRTATFNLPLDVTIMGGYAGYGETDPNARNPEIYRTTLSGDIGVAGDAADNSYHVVTIRNTGSSTQLDGVSITGGNASGSSPHNIGAALYVDNAQPSLHDCILKQNQAESGAAVFAVNWSSPTFVDCVFAENTCQGNGGAFFGITGAPWFSNCTFQDNYALVKGGAICTIICDIQLDGCTFGDNYTETRGGAICLAGGTPALTECTFIDNSVLNQGFTTDSSGGAIVVESGNPQIVECVLYDNLTIDNGGALAILDGDAQIVNCAFIDNLATGSGGGVYSETGTAVLTSCEFISNTAFISGGGLANKYATVAANGVTFQGNVSHGMAGGIYVENGSASLVSCVLWENRGDGGNDEPGQITRVGGSLFVDFSCIQGLTGALGGQGNIGVDPLFVDPDGADNIAGTLDDDLRLQVSSPCIDGGDPAYVPAQDETDRGGDARVICDVIDAGAYEFPRVIADLDCDRDIDHDDLQLWLGCAAGPGMIVPGDCDDGDLDADTFIDMTDFAELQARATGSGV